jgi:uncharacterized protein involved in outer membrane biogenesis
VLKKVLIGIVVLVLLTAAAVFVWARSILATDTVRTALAAQLSKAIGQPVTVKGIGATIFPRVTVNLEGVGIGEPARIRVRTLQVGTDLRALLSRQIAHASLRLNGARIELPLPAVPTSADTSTSSGGPSSWPVEIVSVDQIVLNDVEIVSAGHTLRADVDAARDGKGLALRKMSFRADDATINGTGEITDMAGPVGEVALEANALNIDRFLAFVSAFSRSAGLDTGAKAAAPSTKQKRAAGASQMNVRVSLDTARATLGAMALDHLKGTAHVTDQHVTLDPVTFGLFRGQYDGTMVLTLGEKPDFHLKARLANVDMTEAMAFAGSPNTITGKLGGRIDLTGRGTDAPAVTKSARGTARVEIRDGVVKNLGLLRAVVIATSMRADAKSHLTGSSREEPFSLLSATLRIANGVATTDDLRFESANLELNATGSAGLNGSAVDLKGKVQLSEALSQEAGSDLFRYTQEQGRVTLPATVTGSVDNLSARIDVKDAAQRALKNRAQEEAGKFLKKGLGGIFR